MEYEIIDVENTAIVICDNEPMFLNETATYIIKMYVSGKSINEIMESISNCYEIGDISEEELEESIKMILADFDKHVKYIA